MRSYLTISPSSFTTFQKCSQRFKWQFVDELEPDEGTDSIYAILGTSFHKVMQLHHRFELTESELLSSWQTLFLSYCTDAHNLIWPENITFFLKKGNDLVVNAFEMRERWKEFKVLDTERYVRLEFPNKFLNNVFLTGMIDLVLQNIDYNITCLDWKTSKTKDENVELNDQLTFYVYFIHIIYKIPLQEIFGALAYPYDKQILFTQRTKEQIDSMFEKIHKLLERLCKFDIAKEPKRDFIPDNCVFCPYTITCQKGKIK